MDKIFEKKYSVEVPKLILGYQEEEFLIEKDFFDQFELSPIEDGEVRVKARITKFNTHFDIIFEFSGYIMLECDRCMEPYPHQFSNSHRVIFTYDEKVEKETDDVVLIDRNNPLLSFVNEFYDFLVLEIPIRKVPAPSVHKCAPEILALIQNASGQSGDDDQEIDPRWNDLKNLKDK
ncbi:MAG: DUF177 domain-containing protein [Bacteroidia bacterium]|nr:DUF177 domain-containing protein [Bacteroidia bacterium]